MGIGEAPAIWVADASGRDLFAVTDYELDMAFGNGDDQEDDFELSFERDASGERRTLSGGEQVYIEGTEYGGVVDSRESDDGAMTYRGRTWHGVLAHKVVMPPADGGHVTESGDANACLADLLSRVGLGVAIGVAPDGSGIQVDAYEVERYATAWDAITGMLSSAGAVPLLARTQGLPVTLSAVPAREVSGDSETVGVDVTEDHRVVNHLVCAGEGEDGSRTVVDLYADERGTVSRTQSLYGMDEVAELYSYTSADEDQLVSDGTKRLEGYQAGGSVECSVTGGAGWRLGDLVDAMDPLTGTRVRARLAKKVLKVSGGVASVEYEVGSPSASWPSGR